MFTEESSRIHLVKPKRRHPITKICSMPPISVRNFFLPTRAKTRKAVIRGTENIYAIHSRNNTFPSISRCLCQPKPTLSRSRWTTLALNCRRFVHISSEFLLLFAQGSGEFNSTSGLLEVNRLAERFPRNFAVTHGWQWYENNYRSNFYSFDCVTRHAFDSHLKHSPHPHFHDRKLPPKHAPDCRQLRLRSAAGKYQRLTKLRECVLSCRLTKCSSQMWFILGYQLAGGFTQCISGSDW